MGHKRHSTATPTSPKAVVPPVPPVVPPAPPVVPPADEDIFGAIQSQVESMLDPSLREKVKAMLAKLKVDAERSNQAKRFGAFNAELETELPKWLDDLAKKHSVSLAGRKITIAYPSDGKPAKPSHTPIGAKGNGGNGGREGFPEEWGKAILVKKDGEATYNSPSALARALGLQITSHDDMVDVFENPTKAGTKEKLPKLYKVDAVKGDHFKVIVS